MASLRAYAWELCQVPRQHPRQDSGEDQESKPFQREEKKMTTAAPAVSKPWYSSLTVWGTMAGTVISALMGTGVIPPGSDQAYGAVLAAVSAIIALIGRARAKGPLTL